MPDHHDNPRSPTAERDEFIATVFACPAHGNQHIERTSGRSWCGLCGGLIEKITVRPADSPRPEDRELREARIKIQAMGEALRAWGQRPDSPGIEARIAALSDHGSEDG